MPVKVSNPSCSILAIWFFLVANVGLQAQNRAKEFEPKSRLAVLIGGLNSDPTPNQIAGRAARGDGNSGMYQLRGDFLANGVEAEYFNWNGSTAGNIKQKKARHSESIATHIREWRANLHWTENSDSGSIPPEQGYSFKGVKLC